LLIEFLQNSPIFPKDIVDVPNRIARIAVKPIVVSITTLIGAELLINPANKLFATFGANLNIGGIRSTHYSVINLLDKL